MAQSSARRVVAVALTLLPPTLAALLTRAFGYGLPEWVFFTVCLAAATTGGWLVWRAAALSARQRRRAAALALISPEVAVHEAVVAERTRLSADISAELRSLLVQVRDLAADGDPAAATRIHRLTRQAVSDLRRQLGLLRDPVPAPESVSAVEPSSTRLRPYDLVLGGGVAVLAAAEAWCYPRGEGLVAAPGSVPMTALAALPLIALRRHPAGTAVAVGGIQLLGLLIGVPVSHGFWILAGIGAPLWRLLSRPPRRRDLAAAALLTLGTVLTGALTSADDLGVLLGVLLLAGGGGLLSGRWHRREADARATADRRAAELDAATVAAVEAQRIAYAREIHDTVSHAVGVIAMQASVAQVGTAPSARDALDRIQEVAGAALVELDDDEDRDAAGPKTVESIRAVVDRMRGAGMTVTVHGLDGITPDRAGLAYRIVQEGLTNVARHAHGARAEVTVVAVDGAVTIEIADDGPGPRSGDTQGHGLVGLRERVGYAGGSLDVTTGPDGGCRLQVRLPRTEVGAR